MKKNKILYLIFMIIITFCFVPSVNAAKELTCVGTRSDGKIGPGCVMLKQYENGTYKLCEAEKNNDSCHQDVSWNLVEEQDSDKIKSKLTLNKKDRKYWDANKDELSICPTKVVYSPPNAYYDVGPSYLYYDNDDLVPQPGNTVGTYSSHYEMVEHSVKSDDEKINGNTGKLIYKGEFKGKSCNDIFNSDNFWLSDLESTHSGTCIYSGQKNNRCIIVQLDYSASGVKTTVFDSGYTEEMVNEINGNVSWLPKIDDDISAPALKENTNGECEQGIYAADGYYDASPSGYGSKNYKPFRISLLNNSNNAFYLLYQNQRGENFVTGEPLQSINLDDIQFLGVELTCDNIFGEDDELKNLIKGLLKLIKILVPIGLIGLGILDFAKSVFASSEDQMKKATQKFIMRLIIAVVIFLIPVVLKVLLGISYDIWGIVSPDFCGILE